VARVLYFASLAEQLGLKSETVELPGGGTTVAELIARLRARGEPFERLFDGSTPVLIAVNQEMSEIGAEIGNSDEIAFFPPVTGG
jgi:molybdopterin synthase sulfur carrier subunit